MPDLPKYEGFIQRHFPGWAARRTEARAVNSANIAALRSFEVTYRGGVRGRANSTFPSGELRTTIGGSRNDRFNVREMAGRGKEVYQNNPLGRSILDTETDNIIGPGLIFQADTDDTAFNDEAEERWAIDSEQFDITGQRTWGQYQQMVWTNSRHQGHGLVVLVDRFGQSKLQYIEASQLRAPDGRMGEPLMFDGIETDDALRPIRFHVESFDQNGKRSTEFVDANDAHFIAHLDDPNEVAGTTCYAQVFNELEQTAGYIDAVVQAARAIAAISIVFRKKNAAQSYAALAQILNGAGDPQRVITLENGSIKYVGSEDEVAQPTAQQPMQQTPEFVRLMIRIICMAFGMPLEIGGLDLSQVNFSGGRIGLIAWYRKCKMRQDVARRFNSRVYRWWLSRQLKMGKFKTKPPGYGIPGAFERWTKHTFTGHEWAYTDPMKEAEADLLEISMGIQSPQGAAAERGRDWKKIQTLIDLARKSCQEKGIPIVLSSSTRDETTKTTAIDAEGNPLSGSTSAPLNGIQIASAIDVLTKVSEKLIPNDTAIELITRLNIAPERAKQMVAAAAAREGISPGDRDFQREILKGLLSVPAARETIYNLTDIEDLIQQSGLPPEKNVEAPFIPVVAPAGQLVNGDVIKDPQGDIVGGDVVAPQLPQSAPAPVPQSITINVPPSPVSAVNVQLPEQVPPAVTIQTPPPTVTVNVPPQPAPVVIFNQPKDESNDAAGK